MTKSVRYPQGHVLLRNLKRDFPLISHGEGLYLYDEAGKKYLDASGGALVVSLGHGNRELVEKISRQMERVAYVNGTQFTSRAAEELATRLTAQAPAGLTRASFLCSGSEAIEAALKFARQLWVERKQEKRTKVIARSPGYHGNTMLALSASARAHYKRFFGPFITEIIRIEAPYEYRSPVKDYPAQGADYYVREFEKVLQEEGPETIAAFIFEPVIGSSAGASCPPRGYFEKMQKICRQHGILMIADEVMCGAGRTGRFFASEHFGLEPDLLVMGKGLNAGYVPLSAVLVRGDHVEEMKQGSGYFMHAQTYMQAPSMVAAGLAVLEYMEEHHVVKNSAERGKELVEQLQACAAAFPSVGHVGGLGLFAGVEFVQDRATRAPFERTHQFAERFVDAAFRAGLIVWPNVGQADGVRGDLVMFGPPLTISAQQVTEIVTRFGEVLKNFQ